MATHPEFEARLREYITNYGLNDHQIAQLRAAAERGQFQHITGSDGFRGNVLAALRESAPSFTAGLAAADMDAAAERPSWEGLAEMLVSNAERNRGLGPAGYTPFNDVIRDTLLGKAEDVRGVFALENLARPGSRPEAQ